MHSQMRFEPGVRRFPGWCLDHYTTQLSLLSFPRFVLSHLSPLYLSPLSVFPSICLEYDQNSPTHQIILWRRAMAASQPGNVLHKSCANEQDCWRNAPRQSCRHLIIDLQLIHNFSVLYTMFKVTLIDKD